MADIPRVLPESVQFEASLPDGAEDFAVAIAEKVIELSKSSDSLIHGMTDEHKITGSSQIRLGVQMTLRVLEQSGALKEGITPEHLAALGSLTTGLLEQIEASPEKALTDRVRTITAEGIKEESPSEDDGGIVWPPGVSPGHNRPRRYPWSFRA